MRKWSPTLIGLVLMLNNLGLYSEEWISEPKVQVSAGYRYDTLNWNIAGVHNRPNVLSELKWTHLQMYQLGAKAEAYICDQWLIRLDGEYGKILDGKVQDSDFNRNNRRGEYSRFNCDANRGEVFDLNASIGYLYTLFCDNFFVTPLIGYSYAEQHLRMFDGHVVLFDGERVDVHVHDLHSNYRTKWRGPWVGLELNYLYNCEWDFFGGVEYHWAKFNGTGHWNLRPEFYNDFQHRANGTGVKGYLGTQYAINCNWLGGIKLSYLYYNTRPGVDRTFVLDDYSDTHYSDYEYEKVVSETRLNEVNWHSFRIEANLTYAF